MRNGLHRLRHLLHGVHRTRSLLLHPIDLPEAALSQNFHNRKLVLGHGALGRGLCALFFFEEHVVQQRQIVIVPAGGNRVLLPAGRLKGHALLDLVLQIAVDRLLLGATGRRGVAGSPLERGLLGPRRHDRAAVLAVVVPTLHLQMLYSDQQIATPQKQLPSRDRPMKNNADIICL